MGHFYIWEYYARIHKREILWDIYSKGNHYMLKNWSFALEKEKKNLSYYDHSHWKKVSGHKKHNSFFLQHKRYNFFFSAQMILKIMLPFSSTNDHHDRIFLVSTNDYDNYNYFSSPNGHNNYRVILRVRFFSLGCTIFFSRVLNCSDTVQTVESNPLIISTVRFFLLNRLYQP